MEFQLLPTIETMIGFYQHPKDISRFRKYITLIQGDSKNDMQYPIGSFNPMAKPHVLERLLELKSLGAESIFEEVTGVISQNMSMDHTDITFKVALNLADDALGGWTNRYTTDFDSKFKLNAMVQRGFCIPIFWTSEKFSEYIIRRRVHEYIYRTIWWLSHPKPKTLEDHVLQEKYVGQQLGGPASDYNIERNHDLFHQYRTSDDYALIFNFFYGDEASASLGFKAFGAPNALGGFDYARALT